MAVKIKNSMLKPLITIIFLIYLLSACNQNNLNATNNHPNNRVYPVDKIFREYYKKLGGSEVLGSIISEVITFEVNQCQYTENALMCFNPTFNQNDGYLLFPIGVLFGIDNAGTNGSTIQVYEEFKNLYDLVGGEVTTGKPMTTAGYNMQEKRIEQYFENIGFYQKLDDRKSNLLAYGVYACNEKCRFTAKYGSAVNVNAEVVSLPFLPFMARFEYLNAFGEPLTAPLEIQSGLFQQVFQNIVLIGNPDLPETIHLLDLPVRLGFKQDSPGPQIYSSEDNMVFYIVSSPYGFHVPTVFDQFINQHGGRELSGNPLSEVYQEGDRIRQCYQNYCLDYFPNAKDVRMVALGQQFLQTINIETEDVVHFEYSNETVVILISEKSQHVALNEAQELKIQILRSGDQTPLQNIEAKLKITLPNRSEYNYSVPATNEYGITQITIPAIKRVQNGSVLTYTLCLDVPSDEPICIKDSYLIW
jgi:hypothetical protein